MPSQHPEPLVDADRPIRVAALVSKGAARLRYLLEEDSNRGESYELVGGVVNVADSAATDVLEAHDVPVAERDIHDFYDERDAALDDMAVRREFDAGTREVLVEYEPDLVVLAGYLHLVTGPILDRYFPRIVNCHHGDLTVRDESGEPVYAGLDAVEDALRAGEAATRETTLLATAAVDRGPIVARSRPFAVHRDLVEDALEHDADDVLSAYRYAHRQWMIRAGGGPTLARTIDLIADGRVAYDPTEETVYVDSSQGFYQQGHGAVATAQGYPEAGGDSVDDVSSGADGSSLEDESSVDDGG